MQNREQIYIKRKRGNIDNSRTKYGRFIELSAKWETNLISSAKKKKVQI